MRALEEDFGDAQAVLAMQAKIASGEEELIPAVVLDRLLSGEAPLRVWREYRRYTQVGLAKAHIADLKQAFAKAVRGEYPAPTTVFV